MRLHLKRSLDYHLGRPVLAGLFALAKPLGAVLRRDHGREPVRAVLVAKFQGFGSLIIAKPSITSLRQNCPSALIVFWGTRSTCQVAAAMPEFDEVFELDDRTVLSALCSSVRVLWRLWSLRLDWAIDLEVYSRLSAVLLTLTCARNRAGFVVDQVRARRHVHTHLVYFNRHKFLGEAYARLAGLLLPPGALVDTSAYGEWKFNGSPVRIQFPYVVINPHAGELSLERRWPRCKFDTLIRVLLDQEPTLSVALIGYGKAEADYAAAICRHGRLVDLTGQLELGQTFKLLQNAALVVSNDSGPLHLALSANVPVVGLFGPTQAENYVPTDRPDVIAAMVPLYCSPCVHHWEPPPCGGDNQCMKRLTVEQVLAACRQLLSLPPRPWRDAEASASPVSGGYYPGLVYRSGITQRRHRDTGVVPSECDQGARR
jgi:ADP-heptose:LPS heptosyltransferase